MGDGGIGSGAGRAERVSSANMWTRIRTPRTSTLLHMKNSIKAGTLLAASQMKTLYINEPY